MRYHVTVQFPIISTASNTLGEVGSLDFLGDQHPTVGRVPAAITEED